MPSIKKIFHKFWGVLIGLLMVIAIFTITFAIFASKLAAVGLSITAVLLAGQSILFAQNETQRSDQERWWSLFTDATSAIEGESAARAAAGWQVLEDVAESAILAGDTPPLKSRTAIAALEAFLEQKSKEVHSNPEHMRTIEGARRKLQVVKEMTPVKDHQTWKNEWVEEYKIKPPRKLCRSQKKKDVQQFGTYLEDYKEERLRERRLAQEGPKNGEFHYLKIQQGAHVGKSAGRTGKSGGKWRSGD